MDWTNTAKSLSSNFSDAFFPERCGICGEVGTEPICGFCEADFTDVERVREISAHPIVLVHHYSGRAGQAVRRLKYSGATCLAEPMSKAMRLAFDEHLYGFAEMIVPVPIHWSRRWARGFNQSELLCITLPQALIQLEGLRRVRRTRPQASLSLQDRKTSLNGAFVASEVVKGKRILLVDDVITSGATIDECVKALKSAGATEVAALAFAGIP